MITRENYNIFLSIVVCIGGVMLRAYSFAYPCIDGTLTLLLGQYVKKLIGYILCKETSS
jgi:hypothetical protein